MDSLADNALMLRIRAGEVDRLGLLFERHSVPLFNYFLRLTRNREASEDLVQEVFFRVLKYRHTFRDGSQFLAWVYRIARNTHIDTLRRRKPEVQWEDEGSVDLVVRAKSDQTPEAEFQNREESQMLLQALERLPEEKRELLVLSRIQQLKYREIAEVMSCSVGAVRTRIHRALCELRSTFARVAEERAR